MLTHSKRALLDVNIFICYGNYLPLFFRICLVTLEIHYIKRNPQYTEIVIMIYTVRFTFNKQHQIANNWYGFDSYLLDQNAKRISYLPIG